MTGPYWEERRSEWEKGRTDGMRDQGGQLLQRFDAEEF
jgi:hypothetical protein